MRDGNDCEARDGWKERLDNPIESAVSQRRREECLLNLIGPLRLPANI